MKKLFILIGIVVTLYPVVTFGHVYLLECNPPENGVMSEPPEKISMTFVGSVEPMFSKIEVSDSNGKIVSKKTECKEDDTIMETELDKNLPPGEYTVKWKVMSLDGHKQTGEFKFSIQTK